MEVHEETGKVRLISCREWRDRAIRAETAMRELAQALRGPWAGYPGVGERPGRDWYYTVEASEVALFKRALEDPE